jgi:hypothetical protein
VVTVRSLVCVVESSDKGATLPDLHYHPQPWPAGFPAAAPGPNAPPGLPPNAVPVPPVVGKGDTLLLLQEVRAHRMSHFQLIKLRPAFKLGSPGADTDASNTGGDLLD